LLSLKQRAIRGAFWASAENWSRQLISLVIFMVLARILAPADIGLYTIVTVILTLMQIFLDNGVGEALVQRQNLEQGHLNAAFWINMILAVALSTMGLFTAGTVADLFGQPALQHLIPVGSLIILIGSLSSIQQALLRRSLDFRALAVRTLSSILIAGAVGLGMAAAGCGVWSLAGQQITEKTVGALVLWWQSNWRPDFSLSLRHGRQLLSYSASMIGSQALVFVQHQFDRFMIGLLLGPISLGIYSLGVKILDSFAGMLFYGTASASFATFAKLQAQPDKLRDALFLVSRFSSLIGFPCFVGLAVTAPDLIHTIFGSKWQGSAEILRVLALTGIPWLFATSAGTIARSAGRANLYLAMTAASVALKVTLLLLFITKGLYTLTVAFTIGDFAMIPAFVYVTRAINTFPILGYLRCYQDAIVGSLIMAVAVITVQNYLPPGLDPYLRLIAAAAAGGVVYALSIAVIAWPTLKQVSSLIRMRGAAGVP
jgi:O-antigen/teichoic acid export membrane protein